MGRLSFFGMFSNYSPLFGLIEHYRQIARGMHLIGESMRSYIGRNGDALQDKDFRALMTEVSEVEDKADTIKRNIRNHMPRGLFLPVDRVLFFTYTRQQDDILDAGQDSLYWLSMRQMNIPLEFQEKLLEYLDLVSTSIIMLKPALSSTIHLICGDIVEREAVKEHFRALRANHKVVSRKQNELLPMVFNSEMDFKEIYQLIHFIRQLHAMSHSAEGCADMLRAMIAR
ncbi:MAG: DUF47 family protein [Deltaproteobacteria bacterium]|jgi:predicted phosphate transport protein (TIGR00153 family)|nr:DUF47 family protein [Deltaproteobacteria bacterium]